MFFHCKLLHLNKVCKTEIFLFRHHYWGKKFKNACSLGKATDFFELKQFVILFRFAPTSWPWQHNLNNNFIHSKQWSIKLDPIQNYLNCFFRSLKECDLKWNELKMKHAFQSSILCNESDFPTYPRPTGTSSRSTAKRNLNWSFVDGSTLTNVSMICFLFIDFPYEAFKLNLIIWFTDNLYP